MQVLCDFNVTETPQNPANTNARTMAARMKYIAERVHQIALDKGVTGPAPLILNSAVRQAARLPFPTPRNHGEEIANARVAFERSGSPHAV